MPTRNAASDRRSVMPRTTRRDYRPQAVDVTREERERFGVRPASSESGRALTRQLHEDMKRVKIAAPDLLDPDSLADAVRERDEDERSRKAQETRRVREDYEVYLRSRNLPLPTDEEYDDEPLTTPATPRRANDARIANLENEAIATAEEIQSLRRPRHSVVADGRDDERRPDRDRQPLVPVAAQSSRHADFTAEKCSLGDVDRLWDWIRQDADGGTQFLGAQLASSVQLHQSMAALAGGEQNGSSLARALYLRQAPNHPHIGFALVIPILMPERLAGVHLYLRADVRGQFSRLLPSLLDLASNVMPGMKLAIMDANPSWGKLLTPYGFHQHTIFVKRGE